MRFILVTAAVCTLAACSQTAGLRGPPTHTVITGETLYAIAWRYELNYRDLSRWNEIPAPYTIYPGQRIALQPTYGGIPQGGESTSLLRLPQPPSADSGPAVPPPAPAQPAARPDTGPEPIPEQTGVAPRPKPGAWVWPTSGQVVKQFDSRKKRSLGVDIAGREGQPVRATAAGQVVYGGSGIPSYGRLLIVKHDASFLSAYAHNRKLLVAEGAAVRAGQVIAEMGRDGDNREILHFEIRKNGKPVNPLRYLAK